MGPQLPSFTTPRSRGSRCPPPPSGVVPNGPVPPTTTHPPFWRDGSFRFLTHPPLGPSPSCLLAPSHRDPLATPATGSPLSASLPLNPELLPNPRLPWVGKSQQGLVAASRCDPHAPPRTCHLPGFLRWGEATVVPSPSVPKRRGVGCPRATQPTAPP